MTYVIAWALYALGVLGFLVGAWRLALRFLPWPLDELLLALLTATLVVPWQAGSFEGFYAPAFVVAFFEAFLQASGEPAAAFAALVAGWSLAVFAWLVRWLYTRRA